MSTRVILSKDQIRVSKPGSDDVVAAGRFTYGFETSQEDGVYKQGKIRNFDGNARTIMYTILRGF